MANKTYTVREGFNYRVTNDNGTVKVYEAGDTVTLDDSVGDKSHQLEPLKKSAAS